MEQSNYATKIVDAYIVCDLDDWPRNQLNNFVLKHCLIDATNIVKIVIKVIIFIAAMEQKVMELG